MNLHRYIICVHFPRETQHITLLDSLNTRPMTLIPFGWSFT
ncbi:MAG: hypothetical protein ACI9T9_001288, partial [Oleiphilaceae bacterium]